MRNAALIFVGAMLGGITAAIVMTVMGRMNHSVELQSALSSVVETTAGQMAEGKYADERETVAACVEKLAAAADTDAELTMEVLGADKSKGVLAIQVLEKFKHPNGNIGKTKWNRTVICDKEEALEEEAYEVRFYSSKVEMSAGRNCYKTYIVQEGDRILAPSDPKTEKGRFAGWRDANDYIADFSLPVEQNLFYYAQWE